MKTFKVTGAVLRKQPYKENDFLVDLFTRELGLITLLVRSGKQVKNRSRLELFTQAAWYLKEGRVFYFLEDYEFIYAYKITDQAIWTAYYLNELLLRLFSRNQDDAPLFDAYFIALSSLVRKDNPEIALRQFEASLLRFLGVFPDIEYDDCGLRVIAEQAYYLHHEYGIMQEKRESSISVSGSLLLRIVENSALSVDELSQYKNLMRYLLAPLLGDEPLQSRIWLQKLYYRSTL